MDRLRARSGDARGVPHAPDRHVHVEDGSGGDPEPLRPSYGSDRGRGDTGTGESGACRIFALAPAAVAEQGLPLPGTAG